MVLAFGLGKGVGDGVGGSGSSSSAVLYTDVREEPEDEEERRKRPELWREEWIWKLKSNEAVEGGRYTTVRLRRVRAERGDELLADCERSRMGLGLV